MLGALGVFILWFGWFGFNPGSQLAISGDNAFKVAAILSQQILLSCWSIGCNVLDLGRL
jgi:ammonia channel protein AmtB